MNKYYYENIWEWSESWKEYYSKYDLKLSVTGYEEFLNKLDGNFLSECENGVNVSLCCKNMYYYLFLLVYQNNLSDRIFDYYKIWRKVKNDIPLIQKGVEKKYKLEEGNVYISTALFDFCCLREIMEFILNFNGKSFIYCSRRKGIICEQKSIEIYNEIFSLNNSLMDEWVFLKSLYRDMLKNEAIIQFSSDGEKLGMDIFKKM